MICGIIPKSIGTCGKNCSFEYYHNENRLVLNGTKMDKFKTTTEMLSMDFLAQY